MTVSRTCSRTGRRTASIWSITRSRAAASGWCRRRAGRRVRLPSSGPRRAGRPTDVRSSIRARRFTGSTCRPRSRPRRSGSPRSLAVSVVVLTPPDMPVGGHSQPAWSSDGKRVVFISQYFGPTEIRAIEVATGAVTRLMVCAAELRDAGARRRWPRAVLHGIRTGARRVARAVVGRWADDGGEPVALFTPIDSDVQGIALRRDGRSARVHAADGAQQSRIDHVVRRRNPRRGPACRRGVMPRARSR